MPRYDELEHEGNEDFNFQTREDAKVVKREVEEKKEKIKIDIREKKQKEWLSIDNPYIWDGDYDT